MLPRYRLTPNLFGIAFTVCGLAQCWTLAHALEGIPRWPSDTLWILGAALWLLVLVGYVGQLRHGRTLASELADPTWGPFIALATIVPMLLGGVLAQHVHAVGVTVFAVGLVLTLLVGGWLSGQWILSETTLQQWHPGYFLPTVAGGLVGSAISAALGHPQLAEFLFGYGVICWLVLGSILFTRLFTQPALPLPLTGTIAIEIAPPVVAGNAWFALHGDRIDAVVLGLAGYAVLMAMVQLRLIPLYRTIPFGPGWWAFGFAYASAVAFGIQWLSADDVPGHRAWTWAVLAVATLAVAALATRTAVALRAGRFLTPAIAGAGTSPRAADPVVPTSAR